MNLMRVLVRALGIRYHRPHVHFHGKSIRHEDHDYATFGDYRTTREGIAFITVSAAPDWRWEFCGLVHELVECYLCKHAKVSEAHITAFDELFEHERAAGMHLPDAEPGDDPRAPYREQHQRAMQIEKLLADWLEVDWKAYNEWIATLP